MDIGDTATYSITGGADSGMFSITSGGVLTFNTPPNFEIPGDFDGNGIYDVQVTANDGKGGTNSQFIAITVTNAEDTPLGGITINNLVPFEGDTLTASNDLFDEDGISGPITFQWLRDGTSISGATSNIYNAVQDDVGAVLTVVASFTDNLANSYSFTSAPTSIVNTAAGPDETGGTPPPEVIEDTGYVSDIEEFDSGINSKTTYEDETVLLDIENTESGGLSSLLDVVISTPGDDVFGERYEEETSYTSSNENYSSLPPKFIDLAQLDIANFESDFESVAQLNQITVQNAFVKELFKLSRDLEEAFEDE